MINAPDRQRAAKWLDVSRETLARLELYEDRLRKWQKVKNLVAPSTLDQIWTRHFADSQQILAHGGGAKTWVDLGSGGGFPGLVIAICLAGTDARVHLVESDHRKCAFLRDVARETQAPAVVHNLRIEDCYAAVGRVDMVTARALAPLWKLLDLAAPFIEDGAKCLFLKGQDVESELTEATISSSLEVSLIKSQIDPQARLVAVRKADTDQ
ncbi:MULTISPECIES: 16S rRNA (guanine(527)-N(7))-methyltransferase RsmG [unclassified Beijerinckia]|uniref:16S rRNA (guanine(527)-N(7))-methyltransferase RsmG n=1 Tax=unclassified Beijerinckia TaxID=2638183 RepID=UPI000894FA62|nr:MULTISPECIES: 16S rRNA (guanine(527)-N(7))-methyltransferase RsmG [unclassified Beijerinckia]MDH7798003.1 16S rRNA (guanine527-N7)-methyltransferase [Beijerinckia sp. GAS462]SED05636.1 16S rRNA (guanine527-N7)-methyltransferase [Beijerinckia sp. 28-YEA-48]